MRRLALLAVAVLAACSSGGDDLDTPSASTTTSERATSTSTSSTTVTTSTIAGTAVVGAPPAPAAPPPASPGAAAAPSCPPVPPRAAPDPHRPRYRLRAELSLERDEVAGDLTVRFTPDSDTDRLVFRLWPNSPRIAAAGGRLDTGAVTVDGRSTPAERSDATTLVVRTGPLAAGRTVDVALPWRLDLPGSVNDRVSRQGESVRLGSFFPLLSWEPGVGWATEPPVTGFAEATLSPVADFDVTLTVPPGLVALTSGVEDRPAHFVATAVRDFAASVGRFRLAAATARAPGPVQVTVGVADGLGVSPQTFLAKVVRVMEDLGRRLGPYPWPTFTLGITPNLSGGIEFPAHVQQGPDTIGRTTTHEVAHMWIYGLVGNNQGRDPWVDEGLATYVEGRVENTLGSFVSRPIPADARGRVGEPMTFWDRHQSSYYRGVYVQGAQAVAATGEAGLVDCALRHYVARNAHRIARPADVVAALSLVFPDPPRRMAPFGVRS